MKCALQLLSVRDALAADPERTIEQVAAFGIDGIEVWTTHGHDPSDLGRWLSQAGLEVCAFDVDLDEFEANSAAIYEMAEALGTRQLVVGWLPPTLDSAVHSSYLSRLAAASQQAVDDGFGLAFHLHAEEFDVADDESVLADRLLTEVAPLLVELDLGWAWIAGRDVRPLLSGMPARIPIVHLKDFASQGDRQSFRSVGEGAVPFVEMLANASSVKWLVAEQDDAFVPDELSAASRSCANLLRIRQELLARV